jgi:hypothetical protein
MNAYINKTIPVRVRSLDGPNPILLADKAETPSGATRIDVANVKHTWTADCYKHSYEEFVAIYNHLEGLMYTETLFWCEDYGGTADTNSKYVLIELSGVKVEQFGNSSGWHSKGRSFTLTITESR